MAHKRHTERRAADIKSLIADHEKLLEELERRRKEAPTPPELPPMLMLQKRPVFFGPDRKPLPKRRQAALRRKAAIRQDYLAVDLPFSSRYFPESRKEATDTQAAMLKWREGLYNTMRRLRECFVRSGRKNVLSLFPLANYWGGFGPVMKAKQIVEALKRHVMLLMKELEEMLDQEEYLVFRLSRDVPGVLREARGRAGDSQAKAAEAMNVSENTVKSWEAGRRRHGRPLQPLVRQDFHLRIS